MQIVKVSTGDRIRVTNFVPPTAGFGARVLTGEIRLVSSSKARPGSGMELSAVELSSHLLSRYSDQVCFVASIWAPPGMYQVVNLLFFRPLIESDNGKISICMQITLFLCASNRSWCICRYHAGRPALSHWYFAGLTRRPGVYV